LISSQTFPGKIGVACLMGVVYKNSYPISSAHLIIQVSLLKW